MKDILTDIVTHTHALGFLNTVKVTNDDESTVIESMADDKSVVLYSKTHDPVEEFSGVFGMPNLSKLSLHLKNPEYEKDAKISVVTREHDGEDIPTHIHFENLTGDFQNDYRFMSQQVIEETLETVRFRGAKWDVTFEPRNSSIQRLKLQSAVHSEEPVFSVSTKKGDLVFAFGNAASHAGSFVFESNIDGKLSHTWSWPVAQVQAILNLSGDTTMSISDQGAMQITVDSGLAEYKFILPAQTK